jgi:DNA-binding LytR/AlgR family response regulator
MKSTVGSTIERMIEPSKPGAVNREREESLSTPLLQDDCCRIDSPSPAVRRVARSKFLGVPHNAQQRLPHNGTTNVRPSTRGPRIAVRSRGKILLIDPNDVVAVEARNNYVRLQQQRTDEPPAMLRVSISVLAERLQRYGFIRIHRSILVNGAHVLEIQPLPTGEYGIRVTGGTMYIATRTYKSTLRSLAEQWIGIESFSGGSDQETPGHRA